jgi:hypothetical protein
VCIRATPRCIAKLFARFSFDTASAKENAVFVGAAHTRCLLKKAGESFQKSFASVPSVSSPFLKVFGDPRGVFYKRPLDFSSPKCKKNVNISLFVVASTTSPLARYIFLCYNIS